MDLPEEEERALREQTNPTWPHIYVKARASFDEFINVFPANHIHGVPGDRVEELVRFCEIAGIKPIVLGGTRRGSRGPSGSSSAADPNCALNPCHFIPHRYCRRAAWAPPKRFAAAHLQEGACK